MASDKPSAGHVFKNTFWLWFDHLGKSISFNLLFLLTSLPLVTLPASCGALMHVTRLLIEQKEARFSDYVAGFIRTGIRFTLFWLCILLFFAVCLVDVYFYVRTPSFISAILNSWVLIAVVCGCMLMLYVPTLLIVHTGRGVLKIAATILLANFFFSLKALLLAAVIKLICLLTALPVILFMFTFLALFLHFTYMEATGTCTGMRPEYAKERSIVKEFLVPPQK